MLCFGASWDASDDDFRLLVKTFLIVYAIPDSWRILGKQGTQRMKKPHVISAHAQNRSGPMKYMVSLSFAKVTVVERRTLAPTHALMASQSVVTANTQTI